MALQLKNNASTTLTAAVASTDTAISVADGSVFASLSSGDYFYCTLANADDTNIEIVKVTDITGNTLTVERGYEGTAKGTFAADDIVEQRITRQTLLELGGDPKITTRDYLDEVHLGFDNNPKFNSAKIIDVAKRFSPDLILNWDSYFGPKLKNMIMDVTNNTVLEDDIVFNTIDDISAWISAKFSGTTPTLIMRPYETINTSIPRMTRIYGMNRFFSSLKGRRGNGQTKSIIQSGILSQADMDNIFSNAHGSSYTGVKPQAIWIANNKKNMYGTLHKNAAIKHSINNSGTERSEYDIAGSNWQSITQGSDFVRRDRPPVEAWMYNNMSVSVKDPDFYFEITEGVSKILVYALERDDTKTLSVMIKPIGMDVFVMDLPDFTKYTLEAVAYNNDMQGSVNIKSFNNVGDFTNSGFDYNNGKMRINVDNFVSIISNVTRNANNDAYSDWTTLNTIRFRLRDKSTNEISEISKYGIVYDARHKFGTFRFMVKHFES